MRVTRLMPVARGARLLSLGRFRNREGGGPLLKTSMKKKNMARWLTVLGYSRNVCEKFLRLEISASPESAKHGLTVDLRMHIFSVRWAVFIFSTNSKKKMRFL